ncbi:hypothetical protein NRB20_73720 [Nocardia sp. RB20]|uniref:Uncharacterized protein n=1 Tax=Nocardia macrotermitis TaxID=2585198 RepID=A0A7K0DEU3_9NOCA|nr:hypothetical protein [Nocardia macrotermitis]
MTLLGRCVGDRCAGIDALEGEGYDEARGFFELAGSREAAEACGCPDIADEGFGGVGDELLAAQCDGVGE